MEINNIEVTKEDFRRLLKDLKFCIESIEKDHPERALYVLRVLESHLNKNILIDDITKDVIEYLKRGEIIG